MLESSTQKYFWPHCVFCSPLLLTYLRDFYAGGTFILPCNSKPVTIRNWGTFCGLIKGKHGQGIHSTKMGADKSAPNTPNFPKFIRPNCLPKLKRILMKEGFTGRP